jgi:hypothetical protein
LRAQGPGAPNYAAQEKQILDDLAVLEDALQEECGIQGASPRLR